MYCAACISSGLKLVDTVLPFHSATSQEGGGEEQDGGDG